MSDIEQLEQQKTKLRTAVDRRDAAVRLAGNRDFRTLILDYFCVEECARYARESADPALPPESRADCLAMAQAAGHFKRFMSVVIQMGNKCEDDIKQIDDVLDELRADEVADDTPVVTEGANQ